MSLIEEDYVRIALFALIVPLVVAAFLSCSKRESSETQALYTDARTKFSEINRAFTLQGPERVDQMKKILDSKWDEEVVAKLEQYLKEAPHGMYADSAQSLLTLARQSMNIKALGAIRPFYSQYGIPKSPAEAESLARLQQTPVPTGK